MRLGSRIIIWAIALSTSAALAQESTPKNLYPITIKNKGIGFIDGTGKVVIEPTLHPPTYEIGFSEGLAPVEKDGVWSYIDVTGKKVLTVKSARALRGFSDGLAAFAVLREEVDPTIPLKWGYIDKTGKIVIEPQFDETYGFSEGLGRVVKDYKWGIIDKTGNYVVEPQFKSLYWFSEGFASVQLENGQNAFIDRLGRVVSPSRYTYTDSWFQEGLAPVAVGNKWGYINTKWEIVISPRFDGVGQTFSDGLATFRQGDLWGAIDKTGQVVIEPTFPEPLRFYDGLSVIRVNGKAGFIDKTGKVVIEPQFERVGDFRGGLAPVTNDESANRLQCGCWFLWNYIDKTGKYVWKLPE